MNKPTHKHTHLQAAQSQRTDQSLQKSVLFANAQPTDNKSNREKGQQITAVWQNGGFSAKFNGSSSFELLYKTEHLCFDFRHFAKPQNVGSNGNGRYRQDQTDRKNEQTMTKSKDLIFAQRTFFCFSATAQVAHLVFCPTHKPTLRKTKRATFCQRKYQVSN